MKPSPIVLIGIIASMVSGVGLGVVAYRTWLVDESSGYHGRAFEQILEEVHKSYVEEVSKDQLMMNALRGMLNQLDTHSRYLDLNAYDDLQSETTGQFGGVGIELGLVDEFFTVVTPIDNTPASAAGLLAGDRILELDQNSLKGARLIDVVKQLRGEPGTSVHLRVQRAPDTEPWDLVLTRALIALESVTSRLLEPGYGYIRISQFQIHTGNAFTAALADLATQTDGPLQGLVLDLRDNPGGVLQSSVAVADALLSEGLIVYTEGRQRSSKLKFRAASEDLLKGAPVVVLINGASASAAEIVAGALQDHGRATVMGSRSYGKGSVQSVVPLAEGQALKLTTAYYYTPSGRTIHKAGITPDIEHLPDAEPVATDADQHLLRDALLVLKLPEDKRLHAKL